MVNIDDDNDLALWLGMAPGNREALAEGVRHLLEEKLGKDAPGLADATIDVGFIDAIILEKLIRDENGKLSYKNQDHWWDVVGKLTANLVEQVVRAGWIYQTVLMEKLKKFQSQVLRAIPYELNFAFQFNYTEALDGVPGHRGVVATGYGSLWGSETVGFFDCETFDYTINFDALRTIVGTYSEEYEEDFAAKVKEPGKLFRGDELYSYLHEWNGEWFVLDFWHKASAEKFMASDKRLELLESWTPLFEAVRSGRFRKQIGTNEFMMLIVTDELELIAGKPIPPSVQLEVVEEAEAKSIAVSEVVADDWDGEDVEGMCAMFPFAFFEKDGSLILCE